MGLTFVSMELRNAQYGLCSGIGRAQADSTWRLRAQARIPQHTHRHTHRETHTDTHTHTHTLFCSVWAYVDAPPSIMASMFTHLVGRGTVYIAPSRVLDPWSRPRASVLFMVIKLRNP